MYFIFVESTSFHSDIYFTFCKIVPSALPHFENKSLQMNILSFKKKKRKKAIKEKNKQTGN